MKIKFSHQYRKLGIGHEQYSAIAKLLDVINVRLEDLSWEFLKYDTDNSLFPLPKKGDYLMLIFLKDDICGSKANIFTTLRRRTEEKEKYYRAGIGQWIDVEFITEYDQPRG